MAVGLDLAQILPQGFTISKLLLIVVVVILIVVAVTGASIFFGVRWYIKKKYNQRLVIFEKINGVIVPIEEQKGFFENVDQTGDAWLATKKRYLPRPQIMMGKDLSWWYKRQKDGELINFCLEDMDEKMAIAKVTYVNEDMRLLRTGIYKNLRERYQRIKFWDKYGGIIMGAAFLIIMLIVVIIMMQQLVKAVQEIGKVAAPFQEAVEKEKQILESIDNILQRLPIEQQSGVKPAPVMVPLIPFMRRRRKREKPGPG